MICPTCRRDFVNIHALTAHSIIHQPDRLALKANNLKLAVSTAGKKRRFENEKQYMLNPVRCENCKISLSYNKRHSKFCTHSCRAIFFNSKRFSVQRELAAQYKQTKAEALALTPRRVDWVCPVCKQVKNISIYRSTKIKFCSGSCRNKINNQKIKGSRSKAEQHLEMKLKTEFPHWQILFNDRKILDGLELDVYIPHLKLAIEWNGIFHLQPVRSDIDFFQKMQLRDQRKAEKCLSLGITLLTICDRTSSTKFIKETVAELISKLKQL